MSCAFSRLPAARRHLRRTLRALCAVAVLEAGIFGAHAQVADLSKVPSIVPRLPGDFSGIIWDFQGLAIPPPRDAKPFVEQMFPPNLLQRLTPAAREIFERYRQVSFFLTPGHQGEEALTPDSTCQPFGLPGDLLVSSFGIQFLITDEVVAILLEQNNQWRSVAMNAEHPKNLTPSWLGNSVGHWEGDTLVIDTIGYNDLSSLSNGIILHSTKLHTVERYRLVDGGKRLEGRYHYEDPETLTSAWEFTKLFYPAINQEAFPQEAICQSGFSVRPYPLSSRENVPFG